MNEINSEIKNKEESFERVSSYGYTGCLNFINTNFNMTDIISANSRCEDSVNIVNSIGTINNLIIVDAYKDGLDADFSNLRVLNTYIKKAGNDCIDLSSGDYEVKKAITINCTDKAISVGEKSILNIDDLYSVKSDIGIAVKDSSTVNLRMAKIFQVNSAYPPIKKAGIRRSVY